MDFHGHPLNAIDASGFSKNSMDREINGFATSVTKPQPTQTNIAEGSQNLTTIHGDKPGRTRNPWISEKLN